MNIAELFVGAGLGGSFALLYDAVKLAVKTNNEFKSLLQDLHSTMKTLDSLVTEATKAASVNQNISPEIPKEVKELKRLMVKGAQLVEKCTQVRKWNLVDKNSKSNKLRHLDQEIRRYFSLEVPMQILTEVHQIKELMVRNLIPEDQGDKRKRYVNFDHLYQNPKAPEFVVGMDSLFQELKEKLLQKGVSQHVVSGPPGYGKTTLASQLIHDKDVKGTFKSNIFFLRVSESHSSLTVMVQQMFSSIDEDKVPHIETEAAALVKLHELLIIIGSDEKPVLVVLDDVWAKSQDVLEKFEFQRIPYYKILVTSRFNAFEGFATTHLLKGLSDKDALDLFIRSATPTEGSSKALEENSLQHQIVEKIVGHCKGSPLVLTVVGRSLSVCWNDEQKCKNKLDQLSEGSSLLDIESKILHCLEKSLHDLSSTRYMLKECFMDLGMFPEDRHIPARVLIDIWGELYKLDANGVHAVAILQELVNRNLVTHLWSREDKGLGDSFYGNLYIMQHDLVRQLAIHKNKQEPIDQRERIYVDICKNSFPEWMFKEGKTATKARFVSICTDSIFSSTNWPDMEFPAIEVLLLNFQTNNYSLPSFMHKMVTLKTLVVVKTGFTPVEPSNFVTAVSLPNLKKIRLERIKIPVLNTHAPVFENLEKLSFFQCSDVPNLLKLSNAFPKLEEIEISYCKELVKLPDEICEVKTLRKISVTDCINLSELPSQLGDLENVEVLRFTSCSSLKSLPDSIAKLKKLNFLDISGCLDIIHLPDKIGEIENLKELHMNGTYSGCSPLPKSVNNLEQLTYVICDAEAANLWRRKRLDKLTVIEVKEKYNVNFTRMK